MRKALYKTTVQIPVEYEVDMDENGEIIKLPEELTELAEREAAKKLENK